MGALLLICVQEKIGLGCFVHFRIIYILSCLEFQSDRSISMILVLGYNLCSDPLNLL
jgi:hypothetical protein